MGAGARLPPPGPASGEQTVQCRVCETEEERTVGKYQATYFMVFKCHFGSNIDFPVEAESWVLQHGDGGPSCPRGRVQI